MEKEESNKVCCEEAKSNCCREHENCEHGMTNCCKNWKKCHLMKLVAIAIVIIIAFCLGSQWGELKSESRNYRFERGSRMMNWGDERFNINTEGKEVVTDEVTIKVEEAPVKQ